MTDASKSVREKSFQERFWKKVAKSDSCWNWIGSTVGPRTGARPYGQIHLLKKRHLAHRVSWMISYGDIPKGKEICHHCDNALCVRPDHLFAGTRSDNMMDCSAKGRMPGCPKLNRAIVRKIRMAGNDTITRARLANKYGVVPMTIWKIKTNRTWKHA